MSNDEYSRILLDEYKKYDYLNQHKETQLIKILVSYIKPSFLFKSNILTPIHLGRAVEKENSKDGAITDKDIKWLHENCIGDDDFEENISHVNRRVGFLTGTYWAWKNYEKLGNPDYFGSFGYRRLLGSEFLKKLTEFDLILPNKRNFGSSLKVQFIDNHSNRLFSIMEQALSEIYPEDIKIFKQYFAGKSGFFDEIYIMKKEIFFFFCNWIFPLLFKLLSYDENSFKLSIKDSCKIILYKEMNGDILNNVTNLDKYMQRDIAFIIERLTGLYLYKLSLNKDIRINYQDVIITEKIPLNRTKPMLDNIILGINKYFKPQIINTENSIKFINVVNNYELYSKCVKDNFFIKNIKNIQLIFYDNTKENVRISKRYNDFLNNYDYSSDAWFVFCHQDWQIIDDINVILKTLDKSCIYGPIGSKIETYEDKVIRKLTGFCIEKKINQDDLKITGNYKNEKEITDTFDCQAMIIHSSLVKKYNLRFDENLKWDLYIEDFCINAKLKYKISSYAINICCCHHSNTGWNNIPQSYYDSLKYVNQKYPDKVFAGTVSLIGGKKVVEATKMEILLNKLRQNMELNKTLC